MTADFIYKSVPGLGLNISGAAKADPKEHSLSMFTYNLYENKSNSCFISFPSFRLKNKTVIVVVVKAFIFASKVQGKNDCY